MIIGVAGKARSGKDTVAEYLVKKYKFVRYSFADPIKYGCKEMFGFSDEQLWGNLKEVTDEHWGITPRKVLQIMGTEIAQFVFPTRMPELKKIGRYFWIHRFLKWHKENENKNIVIPDVRFMHEVQALRRLESKIIKVVRSSVVSQDTHLSETELDGFKDFDTVLINDSSIPELNKQITFKMKKWIEN